MRLLFFGFSAFSVYKLIILCHMISKKRAKVTFFYNICKFFLHFVHFF